MAPVLLLLATFATISQPSSDQYTATRDPIKQSAINSLTKQSLNVTAVGKPRADDSTVLKQRAKSENAEDCNDMIDYQGEGNPFRNQSIGHDLLCKHNQSNDNARKCNSTTLCTNSRIANMHKTLFTPKNVLQHTNGAKVDKMNGTHETLFNGSGAINRANSDTFNVTNSNKSSAVSDVSSDSANLGKTERSNNDENDFYSQREFHINNEYNTSALNTSSRTLQNNEAEVISGKFEVATNSFHIKPTNKRENSLRDVENATVGTFHNFIQKPNQNETNMKSYFHTGINQAARDHSGVEIRKAGKEITEKIGSRAASNIGIDTVDLNLSGHTTDATTQPKSTLISRPPTTNSFVLSERGMGKKNELPPETATKEQVARKEKKHLTKDIQDESVLLSRLILTGFELKPSAIKRARLSADNQSIALKGRRVNEASTSSVLPEQSDKQENNILEQVTPKPLHTNSANVEYSENYTDTPTGYIVEIETLKTNESLTSRASLQPTRDQGSEKPEKHSDDNLKQTEINFNFTSDNSKNLSVTEVGVIYERVTDTTSSRPQHYTSDISGDGDKLGNLDPTKTFGVVKYLNKTKASGSLADLKTVLDRKFSTPIALLTTESASDVIDPYRDLITTTDGSIIDDNETLSSANASVKPSQEFPWPVKKEAVVEGDLVLGGLMMVHEREDTITCGPVMPQGGIQALEAMLYTLDRLNETPNPLLPNITLGAHILDDCDKDTYGLEMAVDFIKGKEEAFIFGNESERIIQKIWLTTGIM